MQSDIVCFVELPRATDKLYCWKVRNGSSVRSGETIALIKQQSTDLVKDRESEENDAESSAVKLHKRPTRRKRPGDTVASVPDESLPKTTDTPNDSGKEISLSYNSTAVQQSTKPNSDSKPLLVPLVCQGDGILQMGKPDDVIGKQSSALIIGYIRKCLHPTVIEGLCAVCGKSMEPSEPNNQAYSPEMGNGNDQIMNMSRVTVAGLTVAITESEGQRMAIEDAGRLRRQRKLSLVLDLDHTLVHATNDIRAQQYLNREDVRSLMLPMMENPGNGNQQPMPQQMWMQQHFVKLRPHLKEFLEMASSLYEIGVYTAGTRDYAEQITIMLARHLVGAERDQHDLEQLRYQFRVAEEELARHKEKSGSDAEENKHVEQPEIQEAAGTTGDSSRKRKRVTFTSSKSSEKTDHITAEKIAEIKAELDKAERLEAEAQETRQKLFGSRVVSRTDVGDLGKDVKSLKRVFPCGGTMAVVVDDREDVWANAGEVTETTRKGEPPENLLLVRPYHWESFVGYADVNNAAGFDLTKSEGQEEDESDEQLRWTSDILKRLHNRFYAVKEGESGETAADVLRKMRQEVLSGGSVVLSGLIPLHRQNAGSNGPRPPVIRYVESLGATLLPSVTCDTTHVVAAKDGTDKILAARKVRGCFIVKPSWLMECVWTLKRSDEQKHLLKPPPQSQSTEPHASLGNNDASSSSDDDEYDGDLAAELENEMLEG